MKTTDSVMRELAIKVRAVIEDNIEYDGECIVWASRLDKDLEEVVSHSLAEARREERIDSYKKALDDMFLEICKLAEPDERQPSAGDLHTNMDDIHSIRTMLLTSFKKEVDLLTGDNQLSEHDQELIREGRAMSDFDTRRGE